VAILGRPMGATSAPGFAAGVAGAQSSCSGLPWPKVNVSSPAMGELTWLVPPYDAEVLWPRRPTRGLPLLGGTGVAAARADADAEGLLRYEDMPAAPNDSMAAGGSGGTAWSVAPNLGVEAVDNGFACVGAPRLVTLSRRGVGDMECGGEARNASLPPAPAMPPPHRGVGDNEFAPLSVIIDCPAWNGDNGARRSCCRPELGRSVERVEPATLE